MATRKNEATWVESTQRWRIAVQADGERRQFYSSKAGTKGKIEAEKKADDWLKSQNLNTSKVFNQLAEMYLDSMKSKGERTGHGTAQYRKMESINRIWVAPVIGRKKIDRITNADYQRCIDAAYDAGRSRKTLIHIRTLFSGIYMTARKNRIVLERPDLIEIYQDAPTAEREAMPVESILRLFETSQMVERGKTVECYHIHAFRIMCLLGLRRGEVTGLRWSDLEGSVLHVQRSINNLHEVTQGKTKTANRKIYVFPLAMKEFDEQRAFHKRIGLISPYVFPSPYTGEPDYVGLRRQWFLFCKSNQIDGITLHELRHTNITMAMGKVPVEILKPVVGHTKSMDTFGVYGHETDEAMKLVGETMEKVFQGIISPIL